MLEAILRALPRHDATAVLDARMPLPDELSSAIEVTRVKPSILGRLLAERLLAAMVSFNDTVLCFGNLPPLFKVAGRVVVFIQNKYLIEDVPLRKLPIKYAARLRLERIWFRMRVGMVDGFIVQTPSMKYALTRYLLRIKAKPGVTIRIHPFMQDGIQRYHSYADSLQVRSVIYDFVYIASGEAHKNHRCLIEAWILLAQEGYYPSLALTVDEAASPGLCDWIETRKRIHHLRIENKGELSQRRVAELYRCSDALIYPSTLESFGLPLVEARSAGLSILAGELDYVRDLLNPTETFDPNSAVSIARAVKRFKRLDEPELKIIGAAEFVDTLRRA